MDAIVEGIFIAAAKGASVLSLETVDAIAGHGLRDDRNFGDSGYRRHSDKCQVTLIAAEQLEEILASTGIDLLHGEHRRNLVTRGVRLDLLAGQTFQVGNAVLEFDRPRPPCGYVESLSKPGTAKALLERGGICARIIQSGRIRVNDQIAILLGQELP